MEKRLQVAVLVENHPYDVVAFQKMLDSLEGCDCFVQPIDLFVQDEKNRDRYDVVLWYNMNWDEPAPDSVLRRYMEQDIGKNGQGIVLLHHALLTFLITTDNPSGVHNIAWVRQYRGSRVFCYASGHDNATYADPGFRKVLLQGLRWAAGVLG